MHQPNAPEDVTSRIDAQDDGAMIAMLVAQMCNATSHRQRNRDLLSLLEARPGQIVLEVGCGSGAALRDLAHLTQGTTQSVGIDASEHMLTLARRETCVETIGSLAATISFQHMEGMALQFADVQFDVVFCSRVLMHASNPEQVVAEMVRVAKPGGRILCIEPAHSFITGVDDTLRLRTAVAAHPVIGRELVGMLRRAGVANVTLVPHMQVSTTPPDVTTWRREFQAGKGLRPLAVRAGACTTEEVEQLYDQIDAVIARDAYIECTLHFAVTGTKRQG